MFVFCNRMPCCTSYWFIIGLLLCNFLDLKAQDTLQKELEQAQIFIYQKNPQEAVNLGLSIYEKATELDTKITTLITLVNGYTALNENEKAMSCAVKAKGLAKQSGDIHLQVRALGLLGEQYQIYHLNSISRQYLKEAEKLLNDPSLTREEVAVSHGNIYAVIGNSYKSQIDCKYAIENYDKAITAYKSVPKHSSAQNNLALAYLEKGNCLIETGDFKNAEINYKKAKNIASSNGLLEYLNYAELGLAKVEAKNRQFQSSIERLSELIQDTLSVVPSNIQIETYTLLKENYKQVKDREAYLLVQKNYAKSFERINEIEESNFQQILNFIHHTTFEKKSITSTRSIIIYILGGLLILISVYEIQHLFKSEKQANKK